MATLEESDLFICHASEDKSAFVRPLAKALQSYGARVWYDEFSFSLGDSLSRAIDRGLATSRYAVVVLSKAFFAKRWPEYELRGLVAKELAGGKVILPIWYDVVHSDVLDFSPPLADKLAVIAAGRKVNDIAVEILQVACPNIFEAVVRNRVWREALKKGSVAKIDPRLVREPPIRHRKLPPSLVARIRLIRAALLAGHPHSMVNWIDGFKRDTHPERRLSGGSAWRPHISSLSSYRRSRDLRLKSTRRHLRSHSGCVAATRPRISESGSKSSHGMLFPLCSGFAEVRCRRSKSKNQMASEHAG